MYLWPGSFRSCCKKSHKSLPLVVGDSLFVSASPPEPFLELLVGNCDGDRGAAPAPELDTETAGVGVTGPPLGDLW